MNMYLVPLEDLVNSNSHSNFEFDGKIKYITVTYKNNAFAVFLSGINIHCPSLQNVSECYLDLISSLTSQAHNFHYLLKLISNFCEL